MKTIYVTLRMTPGGVHPVVHINQYDKGLTEIVFTLMEDDTSYYEVPEGASAYIVGTKKDKTGYQYPVSFSGHTVTVTVQDQMSVCSGSHSAEIRIIDNDTGVISAENFTFYVEPSALDDDTKQSKTDLPMVEKAAEAYDATKEAASAALVSEQNAKASETAAKASETAAASYQSKAATSEANAKASETAASASQSAAATSETNAKASEKAAKESETAAAKSESNAAKSETNAKSSETAAASSQSAAATSESNAASSASAASSSQSAAATSEANAKTSETNSASSASAAKTSETNAANSASSAKTSETNAANSATTASDQATAAASSASAAKTSETNAAASAKAAKESEDKCQALAGFTIEPTVTANSANSVMSKGIYSFVTDQVNTKADQTALTAEADRAQSAEKTNADNIAAETARSQAAEKDNSDKITQNYNTQAGVNTALKNRLTALENKHTVTELAIPATGWTAQDDGSIRATVPLTAVYERPEVYLEDSTIQVTKATYDSTVPALYLYATVAPAADFKVIVKGAK